VIFISFGVDIGYVPGFARHHSTGNSPVMSGKPGGGFAASCPDWLWRRGMANDF